MVPVSAERQDGLKENQSEQGCDDQVREVGLIGHSPVPRGTVGLHLPLVQNLSLVVLFTLYLLRVMWQASLTTVWEADALADSRAPCARLETAQKCLRTHRLSI